MRPNLLVQSAVLLMSAQAVLGLVGYLTRSLPWLGLLLTLFYVWFVARTARVLRSELPRRLSPRGMSHPPFPWAILRAALSWQIPALITLPYWMPAWASWIWQGAILPVLGTAGRFWPALPDVFGPWLWVAAILEIGLFVSIAGRPEPVLRLRQQVAAARMTGGAPGEWAPAKRRFPGGGKRRVNRLGDHDPEPEREEEEP